MSDWAGSGETENRENYGIDGEAKADVLKAVFKQYGVPRLHLVTAELHSQKYVIAERREEGTEYSVPPYCRFDKYPGLCSWAWWPVWKC